MNNWTFQYIANESAMPQRSESIIYLIGDSWDDYGFGAMFHLYAPDKSGDLTSIGTVKIGQEGMGSSSFDKPTIFTHVEKNFDKLDATFFSIGQAPEYYSNLNETVGRSRAQSILGQLRDLAIDIERIEDLQDEEILNRSLLRTVTISSIQGQFRRIIFGGDLKESFTIRYNLSPIDHENENPKSELVFKVEPDSLPPSNVHILIGSNGSGKTTTLRGIRDEFIFSKNAPNAHPAITSLISVSFSAFDAFSQIDSLRMRENFRFHQVGLYHSGQKNKGDSATEELGQFDVGREPRKHEFAPIVPKSTIEIEDEFLEMIDSIAGERRTRLKRALEFLESDPTLSRLNISDIDHLSKIHFGSLSSGHKIVLLTILSIVRYLEEKALILIDEPESHLHPPLLAALTRAISWLLADRNGMAIIATHSPVVLQEVPKNCAWKIWRSGDELSIDRPSIQTFGENVGILTREVFGLEIAQSGYHRMLSEVASISVDYDDALGRFSNALGQESESILRGMMFLKNRDQK